MSDFEHLNLRFKIDGEYNSPYGKDKKPVVIEKSPQTLKNLKEREMHGTSLQKKAEQFISFWTNDRLNREEKKLPILPNALPIFLQVDPKVFKPDDLKSFDIEVIAEENDGYIIGATADQNLNKLKSKIDKFLSNKDRSGKPAQLWDINIGNSWRLEHILSEDLLSKWETINDSDEYTVDISIACFISENYPQIRKGETDDEFLVRINDWKIKLDERRDELQYKREIELEKFLSFHSYEALSGYASWNDSFSCLISIDGKGLKDLVFNYPYLFEVSECDKYSNVYNGNLDEDQGIDIELIPPSELAPKICVIDSGIQEGHKLLSPAIQSSSSKSYLLDNNSTGDECHGGGHGTKVAGAILYPNGIPKSGKYFLDFWIQNARIIEGNRGINSKLYLPLITEKIVEDFSTQGTRLYNYSVGSIFPCRLKHMSPWAAQIDNLTWKNDILFIISTGNVERSTNFVKFPGIEQFLSTGKTYPDYLLDNSCRISNPAQSLNALTVGSVCLDSYEDEDLKSLGQKDEISSFSRTGLGIWGTIKPEVVEYGGDWIANSNNPNMSLILKKEVCPELIRSNYHGGGSIGRDDVGTSFAAPKVAHIAANLQKMFPNESCLLYRALIAQSARWPEKAIQSSNKLAQLRYFGYGIPNINRATSNTDYRVTLVNSNEISSKQAHIYSINVPDALTRPGDDFNILIEVTLSYKALPRRTRRSTKSYLSSWLDWESSRLGEPYDVFKNRIIKIANNSNEQTSLIGSPIEWTIKNRIDIGISGVRANESTLQKDWSIVKSNKLSKELNIAVIGHQGWEKDIKHTVPYSIVVSFEAINQDIEIYERMRIENEVSIEAQLTI